MNKPVYYKSFRSRKFKQLEKPKRTALDILAVEENIILDIGFGTGDSTIALQGMFPQHSVLGIEAYKPGVKNLLSKNIYVHFGDALEMIEKINVKVGDKVNKGEPVVEIETDKVTQELYAEKQGILKKILFKDEEEVKIGEIIGIIETGQSAKKKIEDAGGTVEVIEV